MFSYRNNHLCWQKFVTLVALESGGSLVASFGQYFCQKVSFSIVEREAYNLH